jgi:dihydropteroate synthase
MFWRQTTLNCRGILVDLQDPIVMGVINATPDSFYEQSRTTSEREILTKVAQMVADGATIIDIGAMSSRPGAQKITAKAEIERLRALLPPIRDAFPEQVISLDTIWSQVARWALDQGVHMINDISAWQFDPELLDVVVEYKVPYVLMHMQGKPEQMQVNPRYSDVLLEVLDYLIAKQGVLVDRGIIDIIVDPGFGFGKTVDQNYALLQNLHIFKMLERPIMVGLSRKSMIQKVLKVEAENALNGTSALHMVALQQGAQILRTHDVKAATECIELWKILRANDRSFSN